MPKVNLEELEKQNQQQEDSVNKIITKKVGDKTLFQGPYLKDQWFDNYGECQSENQVTAQKLEYKKSGLDESGRTPEQVKLSQEKQKLIKEKTKLLEAAADIDLKIASLKEEDFKKKGK